MTILSYFDNSQALNKKAEEAYLALKSLQVSGEKSVYFATAKKTELKPLIEKVIKALQTAVNNKTISPNALSQITNKTRNFQMALIDTSENVKKYPEKHQEALRSTLVKLAGGEQIKGKEGEQTNKDEGQTKNKPSVVTKAKDELQVEKQDKDKPQDEAQSRSEGQPQGEEQPQIKEQDNDEAIVEGNTTDAPEVEEQAEKQPQVNVQAKDQPKDEELAKEESRLEGQPQVIEQPLVEGQPQVEGLPNQAAATKKKAEAEEKKANAAKPKVKMVANKNSDAISFELKMHQGAAGKVLVAGFALSALAFCLSNFNPIVGLLCAAATLAASWGTSKYINRDEALYQTEMAKLVSLFDANVVKINEQRAGNNHANVEQQQPAGEILENPKLTIHITPASADGVKEVVSPKR